MPQSPLPCRPGPWRARFALVLAPVLAAGLLLLLLWLPAVAQPSDPAAGSEDRAVFTREDGLAANSVTALLRTERVLWVGTLSGLTRYTLRGPDAGLAWHTFTQDDGLAADAVSDLWTDDSGGLWVLHPDRRISFYDGSSWTTYDNPMHALDEAYKYIVDNNATGPLWAIEGGGRVWMLADGAIGYYVGGVWRPYSADAGIPAGELVAVWTAPQGAWVAAANGQIGYFDGMSWTTFRNVFDAVQRQYETITASGPTGTPLWLVDKEGAVWVRNAFNGRDPRPDVRRYDATGWTNFGSADGMASGFVAELRLDQYGRLWARHLADENGQGGGLSLYTGADDAPAWVSLLPALSGNVTDFAPEGTGGVWIGSYAPVPGGAEGEPSEPVGVPVGGLTFVALDVWQRFPLQVLGGAAVTTTWLDENDDLWIGLADNGGLWRYRAPAGARPAQWTHVTGLMDLDVRDLWGDGQDNLWVATAGGVNRITLKTRKLLSYTLPLRPDRVTGDAAGNLWAVALGAEGGVWQWDGDAWSTQTITQGLSGAAYSDVLVSNDNRVFLAGDRGLDIWDGDKWRTFSALPGRFVNRVWQDAAGDLWLSAQITPGRPFNLSLNQGQRWEAVLTEKDSHTLGAEALALLRDNSGRAWLGTSSGLYVSEPGTEGRWQGLGLAEGLPAGRVSALYEDSAGTLWVAAGEQAFRTDLRLCISPGVCGEWRRFEPGVGSLHTIAAGPGASVLFAGDAGVALYHPRAPELRLEQVSQLSTGRKASGNEPVVVTVGHDAVRVDLVALAPTLPVRQLSYRYRLLGADDQWHRVAAGALGGKRLSLTYAGLAGGVYTFTAALGSEALDYSPDVTFTLYVLSRPPTVLMDKVAVAGRPVLDTGALQVYVQQPIQVQLSSSDDQGAPLRYQYRIEGLNETWTETTRSEISFTLRVAGVYTFTATAVDREGQKAPLVGAHIVARAREQMPAANRLPVTMITAGLGLLSVVFIASAVFTTVRRRRRQRW